MSEPNQYFINMVDELIELSESDPELKEGLRWIDTERAQRDHISFYEAVFMILHQYNTDMKAKE